jgi:SNF2 family DNA or RNA helicase
VGEEEEEEEEDEAVRHTQATSTPVAKARADDMDVDMEEEKEANNDEEDDDEYIAVEELDDETTMIEEEAKGVSRSAQEELAALQKDGEMSVEQLRAMYANMPDAFSDEEGDEEGDGEEEEDEGVVAMASERSGEQGTDADSVVSKSSKDSTKDSGLDAAFKRLESSDLVARSVHVERPFVLSKNLELREYQHIGLNWLVSLHERRLNGILADEMGLGKTIQTIALLAYLLAFRGIWGPHLIVVPTSCIVNWEKEFKRFCPAFKILTYYGGAKTRKLLRSGWSKLNSFHVCITSYQLVVQDSNAFRRKRWYYMILDEAHNIKNFKSQRWQTLLNFNTQRRLLLTGTPLQNNLMELWSLMHFLMPHIFKSRSEFSYWFSNPLTGMVEGNRGVNKDLITRLHSIMRPFLLRRLKKEVASQLPGKYEHVVMCRMSKRQMYLYEEFMSRGSVKNALTGGNFMGMMNCLMQLRKVCNHPDLFEVRAIESPFQAPLLDYHQASIVTRALEKSPLSALSGDMVKNLWSLGDDQFVRDEIRHLQPTHEQFITVEDVNLSSPRTTGVKLIDDFALALDQAVVAQQSHRLEYNFNVSKHRCERPRVSFNWRTEKSATVDVDPSHLSCRKRDTAGYLKEVPHFWKELVKDVRSIATDMIDVVEVFTFVLPKATSRGPQLVVANPNHDIAGTSNQRRLMNHQLRPQYENAIAPFYPSRIRQSIFFPDRKLVQFDSGKLQVLAELLRKLKKGGHKCLIFTQMSKMLDILEVFLNLHSYTYVRLDGSTGVDRRQKLMDRFNSDPKLFCFILSTRSGGLGINLTGADTVIFYDSDWNPAMDAQAQDRAHRIGQTRDVHIYRLVTQSTVEENILVKARQKRHLDYLVMTEGNFSEESLFNTKGLQDIFGGSGEKKNEKPSAPILARSSSSIANGEGSRSQADIERAMAAAEDEEDISALKLARMEASKEQEEFDENAKIEEDKLSDDGNDDKSVDSAKSGASKGLSKSASSSSIASANSAASSKNDEKADEKEMEAEFASWQAKVGPDFDSIESALKPVERYALRRRTNSDLDPYYSIYYLSEQQKLLSTSVSEETLQQEMWDVEQIEREKEEEENRAFADGELLATALASREVTRFKNWYTKERKNRGHARRRRVLTGAGWELRADQRTGLLFWYNTDTGEIRYNKPRVIEEREAIQMALEQGWNAAPIKVVTSILSFLQPASDRLRAAKVCRLWSTCADSPSFHLRVLPVESGAREDLEAMRERYGPNVYPSIAAAILVAKPGETLALDPGHHWEDDLVVDKPLRICGLTDDPSRCVMELTGALLVKGNPTQVQFSGLTIRRPRKVPKARACLSTNGKTVVSMFSCVINNEGASGCAIFACGGATLQLYGCTVRGGLKGGISTLASAVFAAHCTITQNNGPGVRVLEGIAFLDNTYITSNEGTAVSMMGSCTLALKYCEIKDNKGGPMQIDEGTTVSARHCIGDQETETALEKCLQLERTRTATKKKDDADEANAKSPVAAVAATAVVAIAAPAAVKINLNVINGAGKQSSVPSVAAQPKKNTTPRGV